MSILSDEYYCNDTKYIPIYCGLIRSLIRVIDNPFKDYIFNVLNINLNWFIE